MWLLLSNDISETFNFNKDYTYLLECDRVNTLVGKNNSGKSYLMREIIKNTIKLLNREEIKNIVFKDEYFFIDENINELSEIDEFDKINKKYISILNQIKEFDKMKVDSGIEVIGGKNSGKVYSFTDFENLKQNSLELLNYLNLTIKTKYEVFSDRVIYEKEKLIKNVKEEYKENLLKEYDKLSDFLLYKFGKYLNKCGYVKSCLDDYTMMYIPTTGEVSKYCFKNYIPLLRSVRHPLKNIGDKNNCNNENIFKNRIIDEYKYNPNEVNVITGLNFYFDYKEKLLGSKYERELINDFETFLSNYFFEGKEISIIPDEKTYELKVNIEDTEDRFIYQVGDGITSLIIIMYNVFMNADKEKNIFFIEEPEQSFHPGFQRLFMNIISLNDKFKNCYFFFTTHSNHLIDISNHEFKNFRNYLCSKDEKNSISIKVQNEYDLETIEELGVNPSSVQIANKIIWIEGKYDALYIRLLLNKKNIFENKRKYIEEYDYVFVPYGGSNGSLINFSIENEEEENKEFILKAKKINNNFLLVMDDDGISTSNSRNKKIERYKNLKRLLKDKIYKLEVREIENLFPEEVVKSYLKNGLNGKYKNNFEILNKIKFNDYKNKKLGEYLNNLVKENLGTNLKTITGRKDGFVKNGFLYDKSKFYDCVREWIMSENFDYNRDIPLETKNLVDVIEKFIEK